MTFLVEFGGGYSGSLWWVVEGMMEAGCTYIVSPLQRHRHKERFSIG